MKSDIEIANEVQIKEITEIAKKLGLCEHDIQAYGKTKAKIDHKILERMEEKEDGKVILVTAISPTPAGEGKTTTTIGLGDALQELGKKAVICVREPSLGPVFGVKGGATGGGYAQVVPMEDINLHFTGDIHAIGAANNLLAAMIDNHIFQGNELDIDPEQVTWKRAVDMNDRQLRGIISGAGEKEERKDGFEITVASEVMAILCLSGTLKELKERLSEIVIGYTYGGKEVKSRELKAEGAMAVLLKDAFNPNLVQSLENTPTFVHGGPFANIAHGCNSVISTKVAMKLGDYVVTEAGFGADLGAEKFVDIKCRKSGIRPSAVVVVATVRALKHHGGSTKENWGKQDLEALERGLANLEKHVENVREAYGMECVVAINRFCKDHEEEIRYIKEKCKKWGVSVAESEVYEKGSKGGIELAEKVLELLKKPNNFRYVYEDDMRIEEKIRKVAQKVYGAKNVILKEKAKEGLKKIEKMGYGYLPICIAKTPYSFSDDAKKIGRPEDFNLTIEKVKLSSGAGFVVCMAKNIMTMPGLSKQPAAEKIDLDKDGRIQGLF